jgi:hypothetical protein
MSGSVCPEALKRRVQPSWADGVKNREYGDFYVALQWLPKILCHRDGLWEQGRRSVSVSRYGGTEKWMCAFPVSREMR